MWVNKDFTVYIWSDKGEFYLKQSKVILQKITAGHHISFVYLAPTKWDARAQWTSHARKLVRVALIY